MDNFVVKDSDNQNMGIFQYGNDYQADRLIMQMVCNYYNRDDCHIDNGFKREHYNFKPLKLTGQTLDPEEEPTNFEIWIEQIGVYKYTQKHTSLHARDTLKILNVSTQILKPKIVKDIKKQIPVYKDLELNEDLYSVNMDDDKDNYKLKEGSVNFLKELRLHDSEISYFRFID